MRKLFPTVLSKKKKKTFTENSVTVSRQQVSIQHFPLPMQSLSTMPRFVQQQQQKKIPTGETTTNQRNQFCFIYCIVLLLSC